VYGKIQEISSGLQRQLRRKPLPEEIAKKANIPLKNVKRVLRANEKVICLDSPIYQGERTTLMDLIPDTNSLLPDSLMAAASIPECVNVALSLLNSREREVIKMRFGIGYENPSTLNEVRKRFGVTRERIRQIEKRALEKLKRSELAPALKSLIA
jgi:RNA polymerase primary sigma factor